ncbi:MAG: hypothetical protein D8H99_36150 [Streptococcus sp.]|jgi:hypothetical protein|nr:MAG: hypothetical protein D8H99_36150 [Streptococcus sp.]
MIQNTGLKFVIRVYYSEAHTHFMQTGYMGLNSKGELQDYAGITCYNKIVEKFNSWKLAEAAATSYIYTNKFNSSHDIRYIPMREDDASWLDVNEDIFKKIK